MIGPFDNAIGWVQLQLRGGWRNMASTALGYGAVMGVLIMLTTRIEPLRTSQVLGMWTFGLLVLQGVILVIFGCSTIGKSIKRDLTGDMILSHRLMPVGAAEAVAGYILGSATQPLTLALATLVLSFFTASSTGVPVEQWLIPHVILLTFSVFVWVVIAYMNFASQSGAVLTTTLIFTGWMGQGLLFQALPGLLVLSSPLLGRTIFSMRNTSLQLGGEYVVSFAAQALIGTLLFLGAMRRYRRGDAPALGTGLGLALLAAWVGVSLCGMIYWGHFEPVWARGDVDATVPFLSTLGVSTLLAMVPVANAGRSADAWRARRAANDPVLDARPVPMVIVLLVAMVIVLALAYAAPQTRQPFMAALLRTAVVVGALMMTGVFFLRTLERRSIRAWRWLVVLLLFLAAGPLLYDGVSGALSGARDVTFSVVSTLSPLGALIQIWSMERIDPILGLIVQSTIAGVMMAVHQLTPPPRIPGN